MNNLHKNLMVFAVFLIPGILLLFVPSIAANVLAGVFFGLGLASLARRGRARKGRVSAPQFPSPRAAESVLREKAETEAEEDDAAVQGKPLSSEYKKKKWLQTEAAVDEMLDTFMAVISNRLPFCTTAIFFPEQDGRYAIKRYTSKSEYVNGKALIAPRRGILGSLLTEGLRPFYEPNFTNKNATLYYYDEEHDFKPEENIRSIMLNPIEAAGETRGILLVDSTKENAYTKDDQTFLCNIAKIMGQAIYYAYLNTANNLGYQRLAAMSSIETDFWTNLDLDAVMDKICDTIPHAVPCDRLTISLKDEEKMSASIMRVYGRDSEGFQKINFLLDSGQKTIASLAYSKEFGFFRNFNEERQEFRYSENEPKSKGFASFMVVPIGVKELKGLMLIESGKKDAFNRLNLELVSRLGTSAGLALEKISIIRKADALATQDGLTGLFNHRQFQKILTTKIAACKRKGDPLSLVLCDIDFFKKLNDTYGHPFGDVVLKGVAAKLESCIRIDMDAAARYGGEEFVLIFDNTEPNAAKESAERIRQAIEALTFRTTDGTDVKTTMSFGIAAYPQHAREINELINMADKALYSAKQNGRNRVEVY